MSVTFEFELASHLAQMIQSKKQDPKYTLRIMDAKAQILNEAPVFTADVAEISKRLDEALRLVEIMSANESQLLKFLDYHASIDCL